MRALSVYKLDGANMTLYGPSRLRRHVQSTSYFSLKAPSGTVEPHLL